MARRKKSELVEQVNVEEVKEVKADEVQLEQPKPKQQPKQPRPVDLSKITITRERRHL